MMRRATIGRRTDSLMTASTRWKPPASRPEAGHALVALGLSRVAANPSTISTLLRS